MARILIVEDERDNRDVAGLILADAGHTVVSASDGAQGVALAVCTRPDLILMDLLLPALDGWEATRQLKAHPATRHIPVVAFTAQLDEESVARAIEAGCLAVIAKPFDLNAFLSSVAEILAQHPCPPQRRRGGEQYAP